MRRPSSLLRQNNGRMSRRAREREFAQLTDAEAQRIEEIYGRTFEQPNANAAT